MPDGTVAESAVPHLDEIVQLAAPTEPCLVWLIGGSMHPTLREGDELFVEPRTGRPRLGDVIVFPYSGRMLAHRVIGLESGIVLAAGDASVGQRERVPFDVIVGIVRSARRHGRTLPRPSSPLRAMLLRLRLAIAYRLRMRTRT